MPTVYIFTHIFRPFPLSKSLPGSIDGWRRRRSATSFMPCLKLKRAEKEHRTILICGRRKQRLRKTIREPSLSKLFSIIIWFSKPTLSCDSDPLLFFPVPVTRPLMTATLPGAVAGAAAGERTSPPPPATAQRTCSSSSSTEEIVSRTYRL